MQKFAGHDVSDNFSLVAVEDEMGELHNHFAGMLVSWIIERRTGTGIY